MADTLDRLMAHHGRPPKAVGWEPNAHAGDARATDMASAGMINVGQLVRERHRDDGVVLVGLSSFDGSVIAASRWGARSRQMGVPAGRSDSHEALLHEVASTEPLLLVFPPDRNGPWLLARRGHRAVGFVYDPDPDRHGTGVPTVIGLRHDALIASD